MNLNQNVLNQALNLLGGVLERDNNAKPIHLVVCGGSSLIMLNLISRTTRDVDIIAYLSYENDATGKLKYASTLPDFLKEAAARVANDLGLDKNWMNTGPKDLLRFGLPEGFRDRLHMKNYGAKLTISFIDRIDQIHFKMYAAVDSGPGRHVDDLLTLNPTKEEIAQAVNWVLIQDSSPAFKQLLIEMLKALNYDYVTAKFEK